MKIDSLVNNFLIPLADIPDGVLRVTLGVPDGLPLCERLVFLQRNQNERLIVTTDKIEYKTREKVTVTIALSGDSTLTDKGDFSMAVVDKKLSDSSAPYSRSITSWFLLESDVRGPVEDPGNYFDPDNDKRLQELDLLLLTQGWRDFKWKYDTLTPFKHEVGFTLAGQVNRILNNNPVSGAKINAALFHMNTEEFIDTRTDKDGKFRFEELEVYGKVRTFLSSTGKMENMQGKISVEPIIYNPPPAEKLHRDTASLEITQKELASYKQEASYRLNALKKYKLSDTISIGEVTITATKIETPQEVKVRESRRIYTAPDKELIVQPAQENFSGDVFSYLSGRIPGVQVVRGIDKSNLFYPDDVQIFIRGQYSTKKIEGGSDVRFGALILLDGYELEDAGIGFVLNTPMNAIDRIDVLNCNPALRNERSQWSY